jgi:hypothetical protein
MISVLVVQIIGAALKFAAFGQVFMDLQNEG